MYGLVGIFTEAINVETSEFIKLNRADQFWKELTNKSGSYEVYLWMIKEELYKNIDIPICAEKK
jgi:hypothetical protein